MWESKAYEKSVRTGKPKCPSHKGNCSLKSEMRHDMKVSKRQIRRKVRYFNKNIAVDVI